MTKRGMLFPRDSNEMRSFLQGEIFKAATELVGAQLNLHQDGAETGIKPTLTSPPEKSLAIKGSH